MSFGAQVLIFGPSLNATRRYQRCFRDRGVACCKRIYRNLVNETLGDICQLSALLVSYLERVVVLEYNEIERLHAHEDILCFGETKHSK